MRARLSEDAAQESRAPARLALGTRLRAVGRPPLRQPTGVRLLEVGAARVTGAAATEIGRGLPPHHHEALHRGECREHEHDPEDGHEDVEREADAEEHQTLGALHEPAARGEAQRLGAGSLVGDEHRQREHREHEHRDVLALVGEVPGDADEDRGVGDAVAHGVEERAAWAGPAALAGDRPVEDVGEAGEDEADHAEHEVAVRDRERRADGEGEADDREAVSRDADTVQAPTDGFEPSLDIGAPATVEHCAWSLRDPWPRSFRRDLWSRPRVPPGTRPTGAA